MTGYNEEVIVQMGVSFGEGVTVISPTLVAGVAVDERLYFGGGVGYEEMGFYNFTPLFADFRYYFERRRLLPYLFADVGYAFGSHQDYELGDSGGLMASVGIGYRKYIARRGSVNLQVSFRAQGYKNVNGENATLGLLGFTVGLCFY
jgi:hypothetical protein